MGNLQSVFVFFVFGITNAWLALVAFELRLNFAKGVRGGHTMASKVESVARGCVQLGFSLHDKSSSFKSETDQGPLQRAYRRLDLAYVECKHSYRIKSKSIWRNLGTCGYLHVKNQHYQTGQAHGWGAATWRIWSVGETKTLLSLSQPEHPDTFAYHIKVITTPTPSQCNPLTRSHTSANQ